jgi:hypothetical protein
MLVPSTTTATVSALQHFDTPQPFVCEWVEDDILKIIITRTLENFFTKNPTEAICCQIE